MEFPEEGTSLNKLLQWSISHSDPEKLAATAPAGPGELDPKWLDAMFPDEAKKMKAALVVIANPELSLDDRERAMDDLLFMCENIDAAADLPKVDGIAPLLLLIQDSESPHSLRVGAAWVLSTACQNNPYTQKGALNRHAEAIAATHIHASLASAAGAAGAEAANAVALAKKLFGILSALVEHEDGGAAFAALANGVSAIAAALASGHAGAAHRATVLAAKVLALPAPPPQVRAAFADARLAALVAGLWTGSGAVALDENVSLAEASLRFCALWGGAEQEQCNAGIAAALAAVQGRGEYDEGVYSDVVRLLAQQ